MSGAPTAPATIIMFVLEPSLFQDKPPHPCLQFAPYHPTDQLHTSVPASTAAVCWGEHKDFINGTQ